MPSIARMVRSSKSGSRSAPAPLSAARSIRSQGRTSSASSAASGCVVGAAELGGAEHDVALAGAFAGRSGRRLGAPTIRSSMPSPLTSPARATEVPLWSPLDPVEAEAVRCRRARRDRGSPRSPCPCRTPRSSRRRRSRPELAPGAPTIRSSKPSPLTSPAPATEKPLRSSLSIPSRRKPFVSVERARDRGSRAKPAAVPNTT